MVGIGRAKDIVMRSRRITGREAGNWGIATVCIRDGELEAAADALVDELRAFAPLAQRAAKKLLNDIEDASLSLAIELEGQCYSPEFGGFPRRRRSLRRQAAAEFSRKMMRGVGSRPLVSPRRGD